MLNDVLSFNRMESGNLIQARQPFDLHKAVHYVALSHRATAEMNGLDFDLELDPRIEEIGGTVIGDEMRFKQVCSNLVSNAFKFTPSGGVKVVTKLLFPVLPERKGAAGGTSDHGDELPASVCVSRKKPSATEETEQSSERCLAVGCASDRDSENTGSSRPLRPDTAAKRVSIEEKSRMSYDFAEPNRPVVKSSQGPEPAARNREAVSEQQSLRRTRTLSHPRSGGKPKSAPAPPRKALIRVEVHDTGVGLSLSDMRDNRLFSPYVQTEIGRRQGGKGSGLGLALIMQIVKLSRGRLGVNSELGKGSIFW